MLQRLANRDLPPKAAIEILGCVVANPERPILDQTIRQHREIIERESINEGLQSRTWRAPPANQVKRAFDAADPGANRKVAVIDNQNGDIAAVRHRRGSPHRELLDRRLNAWIKRCPRDLLTVPQKSLRDMHGLTRKRTPRADDRR